MGLTIVLENEQGETIDRVEDPTNILHRLLPTAEDTRYRCIGFIDWYGDTVFNRVQAKVLVVEWQRLAEKASNPDEQALLERIQGLAERIHREPHLYLKFYGD